MNGPSDVLVDTNLIILGIGGNKAVRDLLEGRSLFISIITEIELLSLPFQRVDDERLMKDFISNCYVVNLDDAIKNETIGLRKMYKIKIPDAIIAASSIVEQVPLYTADKGFSRITALHIVLY